MKVGVATDHGGFALKEELLAKLQSAGHEITNFGAHSLHPHDDYPDFRSPCAAFVTGDVERGVAICGLGVGASVCVNKMIGIRAALIHDHVSARREWRTIIGTFFAWAEGLLDPKWPEVAWDLVQAYLSAEYSEAEKHRGRLAEVAGLENK